MYSNSTLENRKITLGKKLSYIFFLTLSCFVTTYFFFYKQINSNFLKIFGTEYDSVIEAVLVSHWYHVLKGEHIWNMPLYFFPHTDISGYNDVYLIYGLISSVWRVLGADLLLAQELTHIVVKAIGFLFMAILMNRLQTSKVASIFSASLFTLFINSSTNAGNGQLLSVAFSPVAIWLLLKFFKTSDLKKSTLYGVAFILFFVSWMLTSFYMAWFLGLFIVIASVVYVVLSKFNWRDITLPFKKNLYIYIFLVILFAICTIPFLVIYIPKLLETGGQSYSAQIYYSVLVQDIINLEKTFFGLWWNKPIHPGNYKVGVTADIAIIFLCILVADFVAFKRYKSSLTLKVLLYSTLISFLLPISINEHSLWYFVNMLVPGATGVRVIARYYIFLAFPLAMIFGLYASQILEIFPKAKFYIYVLMLSICICQINLHPQINLEIKKELGIASASVRAPSSCESFFVSNPIGGDKGSFDLTYRQNTQAMMIADHLNLPTINGLGTFNPRDWHFNESSTYFDHVKNYIKKHNLKNICMYDIGATTWYEPPLWEVITVKPKYRIGDTIEVSDRYLKPIPITFTHGWSAPEAWGIWSDGLYSEFKLVLTEEVNSDLLMSLHSHAFLLPGHNKLDIKVSINDHYVKSIHFNYPDGIDLSNKYVEIPLKFISNSKELNVKFEYSNPASPQSFGLSGDNRDLALGLSSFKLEKSK
jgi:hypothetical protein